MANAYIALGSNLGDRRGMLREALRLVGEVEGTRVMAVGPILETAAVDAPAGSGPFLNTVAAVETGLGAEDFLGELLGIERRLGRARKAEDVRNGPRVIDLDVLLYDDVVLDVAGLRLPHPRMHERRFVLEPLAAIAPELVHPVLKKTVAELLRELPGMRESA